MYAYDITSKENIITDMKYGKVSPEDMVMKVK